MFGGGEAIATYNFIISPILVTGYDEIIALVADERTARRSTVTAKHGFWFGRLSNIPNADEIHSPFSYRLVIRLLKRRIDQSEFSAIISYSAIFTSCTVRIRNALLRSYRNLLVERRFKNSKLLHFTVEMHSLIAVSNLFVSSPSSG